MTSVAASSGRRSLSGTSVCWQFSMGSRLSIAPGS